MVRIELGAMLATALLCAGCTAQPSQLLPPRSIASLQPLPGARDVSYEITVKTDTPEGDVHRFPGRFESCAETLFARARPGVGQAPLHLAVSYEAEDRSSFLRGLASALTVFLLPDRRTIRLTLRADALWKGAPLRSYTYTDEMSVYFGVIYLAGFPGSISPTRASAGVMDNLLATFFTDLRRDVEALP